MSNSIHEEVISIAPQRDHVLLAIKKEKNENVTNSGIVLVGKPPQTVNSFGEVIAVGNGRYAQNGTKIPVEVSIGDEVIFYEYAGVLIKETEDYIYKLLKENDILATISQ